jgi:hypothetical protein
LFLGECPKIDDVFDHLARLRHVTLLYLDGNAKITDAGLVRLKDFPKLERLVLANSPGITAAGVVKLRAALPKLRVEWDGDPKGK